MGYAALLIPAIVLGEAMVLIGTLLASGLGALGIDAYNKKTKAGVQNKEF